MTSPTNCPCDAPPNTEAEIAIALSSIAAGQRALARQVRTFPGVREALLASLFRGQPQSASTKRFSRSLPGGRGIAATSG
jgi:hypothetical protein